MSIDGLGGEEGSFDEDDAHHGVGGGHVGVEDWSLAPHDDVEEPEAAMGDYATLQPIRHQSSSMVVGSKATGPGGINITSASTKSRVKETINYGE